MAECTKTYKTAAGNILFRFTYNNSFGDLDFEVVNIADLEYGYEDEDQLTFYPNVLKFEFTDFERKNYEILKLSLNTYSPPGTLYETIGKIEVFLNRGSGDEVIYEGYIEPESLSYDDETRITSFEAVDKILQLKNLSMPDLSPEIPLRLPDTEKTWANVPDVLLLLYKRIYPEIGDNVTTDLQTFNSADFKGLYFDHGWNFILGAYTVPWNENPKRPSFTFSRYFWADDHYPFNTISDFLKQIAIEFGAYVGSPVKNKIFFKKRYIKRNSLNTVNITSSIIKNSFSKIIGLKKVQSVINNTQEVGKYIEGNYVENPSRDVPNNLYENLEIGTYFWSYTEPFAGSNVSLYNGEEAPEPFAQVVYLFDRDLDSTNRHIQNLITRYTYLSRINARDRFEMTLTGIDYNIFTHYSLTFPGIPSYVLRPLTIKKNLLNNTTQMTALEVGL